jgi:hypothetical protein
MSDPITLVVWPDAVKDPPTDARVVWTNRGDAYFDGAQWSKAVGVRHVVMVPQPTVWCDPVPPTKDALTVEELRRIATALESDQRGAYAARLRAALPKEGGDDE